MSKDWGRSESEFKLIECISALLGDIPGEAFAHKPSEWDSDSRISVNKSLVKVLQNQGRIGCRGLCEVRANLECI